MTRRSGIGLIEAMISLAICAILLVGVATAFRVSADAISENDAFIQAAQGARVSMTRVLAHIRRGTVSEVSANQFRVITDRDEDLTYQWIANSKQLMMITNGNTSDADFVLARNVTSADFQADMGKDSSNTDCVIRVTVSVTVKVGENEITLSGAASPRVSLAR